MLGITVVSASNYRHEHNQLNTYCRAALDAFMSHDVESMNEFTERIFPAMVEATR
jgi:hypothetical protein